jgi:sodium-dependent dicarboxylate transporter 2/3/5
MADQDRKTETTERVRVLIVDDEDRFRESLSKQLEMRGFEVFDASNGEDAIKIVRHDNPEVVILDQKMP